MLETPQRTAVLERLDALARQGARVSGDDVLGLVVDLAGLGGGGLRPGALGVWSELVLSVMSRASPEARAAAAARVARMPDAPPDLLSALAREPLEVAGPVLQHAEGLAGPDLVRLASEVSPGHLRALARRAPLAESVTDLLVLRGDREAVILALLNRRARLSSATLLTLADRIQGDPSLKAALIQRSDLPDLVVDRIWPLLDREHRARLVAAGWRYSAGEAEEAVREAGAGLLEAVRGGVLPRSVDTYRTLVEDGQTTLGGALAEILGAGRLVEAAQLMARLQGLAEGAVLNLLYGAYDHGVALLAHRAGLDEAALTALACARSRLPFVGGSDVKRTLRVFAETDEPEAEGILDLLDALWWAGVAEGGARRRFRADGDAPAQACLST